jgi:predicted alpha/beta-hydrolase family hydrolase
LRGVAEGLRLLGLETRQFDFDYMRAGRRAPDRPPILRARLVAEVARSSQPLILVGKSMGGRVAAEALVDRAVEAEALILLGYPLGDKPERAATLRALTTPTLVVQGTRDSFGGPSRIAATGTRATIHTIDGADHSFAVRGRSFAEVLDEICGVVAEFSRNRVDANERLPGSRSGGHARG